MDACFPPKYKTSYHWSPPFGVNTVRRFSDELESFPIIDLFLSIRIDILFAGNRLKFSKGNVQIQLNIFVSTENLLVNIQGMMKKSISSICISYCLSLKKVYTSRKMSVNASILSKNQDTLYTETNRGVTIHRCIDYRDTKMPRYASRYKTAYRDTDYFGVHPKFHQNIKKVLNVIQTKFCLKV